ncbi:MAG: hypothetical protein K2H20_00250, partial [Bacilli bacterium]|nr:hypothetical protein [Bacilli bacterium]
MNDRTNERIFYSIIMYPYYKSKINKQYRKIFDAYSYEECITEMEKVYRMIKKSSALYYNGSNMNCLYDGLKAGIIRCEDLLEGTPIIESDPYFIYNNEYSEKTKFIDLKNTQEKLNYIVWCARKNIVDRYR